MVGFEVYQIPYSSGLGWIGYNASIKTNRIHMSNYNKIYSGVITDDLKSDDDILEYIYNRFNKSIPSDYTGFPVAVSDIVHITNNDKYYFRDRYAWINVDEIIKPTIK